MHILQYIVREWDVFVAALEKLVGYHQATGTVPAIPEPPASHDGNGSPVPPIPHTEVAPLAVDGDATVKPPEFVGTPIAAYRCMFEEVKHWPGVTAAQVHNLEKNGQQNWQDSFSANSADKFDLVNITQGRNFNVAPYPGSGAAIEYPDVLVFRFDNASGPGFKLADCAELVRRCTASGAWPNIDHSRSGPVAV